MTPEERAAFLALLRRLEWSAPGEWYDRCPVCETPRPHPHTPGCELAACIRVLGGDR